MTTSPTLNPDAIQALRDLSPEGDSEFLRELIAIYLADTPRQLAQMEEALAKADASLVIRAAHSIKGSSGNFGAQEFARIAQEIESHAKANNLAAASAALPELKLHFARVVEALKQLAGT
ncbi:Hpt domain-containing protein [Opitutus sp. GAS368]|jgi:HPt (histidine-containing phosphotransfer) domain-containing protein|uniref:Hpt domain-containing protein n=1 Tax=Opitutus sp. GAS368 TaxID=1882749 RepID=UPI00087DA729|nr:Hpt domain-containing protein [Opitutus sp. GAS368]SDS52910.1 HPt (histidine-containing phosphotransfer) domain-containing protein [Opitutus sp. GAS368]